MGQDWELVNIDKGMLLRTGYASSFWEHIRWTPTEQLVGLLKKPHWVPFQVSAHKIRASKAKMTLSHLVRLPQEIINLITDYVGAAWGEADTICLALACTYFFRLLAGHIQDIIRNEFGPWAGDRLVFTGDAGGRGWPYELWELLQFNRPVIPVAEGKLARRGCGHLEKFESHPVQVYGQLRRIVKERLKGDAASFKRFKRLAKFLTIESQRITYGNKAPVLRNLTTKEYVRDEALASSEYAYSLGEVVMVQTIWSEDSKDVWRLGTEARWKCHRFDISVMEDVIGDEWIDVSTEAVERITLAATEQFRKRNGRRVHWYNGF